jgi:glutamate--cysteine ligase
LSQYPLSNEVIERYKADANNSLAAQRELEVSSNQPFSVYLDDYFSMSPKA